MIKSCEKCGRRTLWFLVKQRWYIAPTGDKIKSELAICGKCGNTLKKMFADMQRG